MGKFKLFLFACMCLLQQSFAQTHEWAVAKELMEKENYALAQAYFSSISESSAFSAQEKEAAQFFSALCAMELFNSDADYQFQKYLNEYPNGPFSNEAVFRLGTIYFRTKNYTAAIAKFNQLKPALLKQTDRNMLYFRWGYAAFVEKDYETAKLAFYELQGVAFKFSELTQYYVAHIAYLEGNYETAYQGFKPLLESVGFAKMARYYVAQIYYFQKRYDELLTFAKPLLDSASTKRSPEVARLIADAYYQRQDYKQSIVYLERFQESSSLPMKRLGKYQLGYAYYQVGNWEQSIKLFQEVLQKTDSLAQYAAYHLADCYLASDQKTYALNAYKHAASFNFDLILQEDAAFKHVKLVYEQEGGYVDVVAVFQKFIADFPESENRALVENYLIKSYSSSKDYQSALLALAAMDNLTFEQKQAYQRMAYFRGVELFNSGEKAKALKKFEQSLSFPLQAEYIALCHYWSGEALHSLGAFDQAVDAFERFLFASGSFRLSEFENAYYALGYANYQLQNYSKAISWFRKYIKNASDTMKLNDVCLRAADAYYLSKKYDRAAVFYEQAEAVGAFDVDYAIYQQAQCYGLSAQEAKKQAALSQLIADYKESPYVDDAKYTLAETYLLNKRTQEGMDLLTAVITEHPFSPLVKTALLKLALFQYNTSQSEQAIASFKQVIEDFPATSESEEALVGLKNVYVESGEVQSYFDYVSKLSDVSVSASAQDSITYEAAEMLYGKGEAKRALFAFQNYLERFPKGLFALPAHYYSAEILDALGKEEALKEYIAVLEWKQNQFTERSLAQAARIEFTQFDFAISAMHYTQLLAQAQDKSLQREATIALLECQLALENEKAIIEAAEKVMRLDKLSDELQLKARLVLANFAFKQSEYHLANKHYEWIAAATTADAGAEAKYQLAFILYLQEEWKAAESCIFALSEQYVNDYFVAKAFVLLAKIYQEQGNLFQAKATLESVIDNHEGEELTRLAKERLNEIVQTEESLQLIPNEQEVIIDLLEGMEIDYERLMEIEENLVDDEE